MRNNEMNRFNLSNSSWFKSNRFCVPNHIRQIIYFHNRRENSARLEKKNKELNCLWLSLELKKNRAKERKNNLLFTSNIMGNVI